MTKAQPILDYIEARLTIVVHSVDVHAAEQKKDII